MMRNILLLSVLGLALAAAGCAGNTDESTDTGDQGIGSSGVDGTGSGGATNDTGAGNATTTTNTTTGANATTGADATTSGGLYG